MAAGFFGYLSIMSKKLFLLDALALIYRAYYALIRTPRITSTGINTNAQFGFTNTLLEIIRKENPTHIAVWIVAAALQIERPAFLSRPV